MKKCIILGGAGFIGSHLCDLLLKKKFQLTVIDNLSTGRLQNISHIKNYIKFVKADISINGPWKKEFKGSKFIFHLAALADIVPSIENPRKYFQSNVNGTFNILEAMREYKINKIIYTASSSCYGIPSSYPTSESEKIDTKYPYATTKYLGEQLIINWSKIYKINYISLRLFNVYGTRSRTSGTYGAMFGTFLAQKLNGYPFTIVGTGEQKRDFVYVTDVTRALYLSAVSRIKNKIFNVGFGKPIKINKVVSLLKGSAVKLPKRPAEPYVTHANIKRIKKYINWAPKISIQEGVKILLNDINYWKNAPVWTAIKIKRATKAWFKYLR
jgi:UDP-glucose 4-epimerase